MKVKPIAKLATKAGKHKPELLAIGGGATVIAAFILAIKGGVKVKETMADTAAAVEAIEAGRAQKLAVEGLSEAEKAEIIAACNKDLKMARIDGVWQMTKLFLLPTGMLFVGLSLIGKGHTILRKRNVVLATALKGTESTLKFYRDNVVKDLGKDADLKYLRGLTGETIDVETTHNDPETGNVKKVKKKVPVVRSNKNNPWRFEFSETYFNSWVDNTESNLWFLKSANEYWQRKYEDHGDQGISMYEVLNYLGYKFEVNKAGMTRQQYRDWLTFLRNHGWKRGCGDDLLDFGLYRGINEPALLRQSDVIFVEFNCAGNLQELI
jgi:hypothetical protein